MDLGNAIQLLKTASGLLLSQKYVAIYEEATYSEGNGFLGALGIDTNQALFGAFSGEVKEVLKGGTLSDSLSFLNGIASYLMSTEVLSANVRQDSRIMEHPLEISMDYGQKGYTNAQNYIADHSIILPNSLTIRMAFPSMLYQSVYTEAEKLWKNKTMLLIQTKAATYRRMVLKGFSHTEEPSTISRMNFDFNFREIQAQYPVSNQSKTPNNSSATGGVK